MPPAPSHPHVSALSRAFRCATPAKPTAAAATEPLGAPTNQRRQAASQAVVDEFTAALSAEMPHWTPEVTMRYFLEKWEIETENLLLLNRCCPAMNSRR